MPLGLILGVGCGTKSILVSNRLPGSVRQLLPEKPGNFSQEFSVRFYNAFREAGAAAVVAACPIFAQGVRSTECDDRTEISVHSAFEAHGIEGRQESSLP